MKRRANKFEYIQLNIFANQFKVLKYSTLNMSLIINTFQKQKKNYIYNLKGFKTIWMNKVKKKNK